MTYEQVTARLTRACAHCGEEFVRNSNVQKFCSNRCKRATEYAKTRTMVTCACGTEYHRSRHAATPPKCIGCLGREQRGPNNPNWKGGLWLSEGRWKFTCRDGATEFYARAVLAATVGRLLEPDEHAHHINGDTQDDRPENLQLLSASEHGRLSGIRSGEVRRARKAMVA